MKTRDWLLLTLLSIIWGSSFMFIKTALRQLSPFYIVFTRMCVASVFMFTICRIKGLKMPDRLHQWVALAFLGFINSALPFFLISWAQMHLDTATTSILNATSPVFIMILAHFFTDDEKLTKFKVTGVTAGIIGIIVMVYPSMQKGIVLAGFAQLAILGATFNYALAALFARRFKKIHSMVVTAVSLFGAGIACLPGLLFFKAPDFYSLDAKTLFSVGMLSIFCTGIAYLIYFSVIASAGATNGMLVTLMIPVSALLISNFIMKETLKINDIAGMILIFSGLIIIDGRIFSVFRK